MATRQARRIVGAVASGLVLVLASCAGEGAYDARSDGVFDGRLETPDVNPAPPTTASRRFTVVRADAAAARRALLSLADLGDGWEESGTPDAPDEDDDRCFGGAAVTGRQTAEAISPFFVRDDETTRVTATVVFFDDEQPAREVMRLARDPAISPCFNEMTRDELAEVADESFETADITTSLADPGVVGDEAAGLRVRIYAPELGEPRPVYIESTLVRRGRVVVTLSALSLAEPYGSTAAAELLGRVLDRLPATG